MIKTVEISLDEAKKMIAAGRALASQNGWRMAIAVVDSGGHPILVERMDGAQRSASVISVEKAWTPLKTSLWPAVPW